VPDNQTASIQVKEYTMKPVLKSLAVAVLLAASQSALSSPFPSSEEAIDRQLPPYDTHADWHARNGTLMAGSSTSAFPSAGEPIDRQLPPYDTYADRQARSGTLVAGSGASPFPGNGDPVALAPFDTYADRYARESGTPTSAELAADKRSVAQGGRS
jgi:hypothetical protein